jgi:ribosome modulation factor
MEKAEINRDSPAFREGVAAFQSGASESSCPYPKSDVGRASWFTGYFHARTDSNVGRILDHYGVGRLLGKGPVNCG